MLNLFMLILAIVFFGIEAFVGPVRGVRLGWIGMGLLAFLLLA
jgi:hypothetical protein